MAALNVSIFVCRSVFRFVCCWSAGWSDFFFSRKLFLISILDNKPIYYSVQLENRDFDLRSKFLYMSFNSIQNLVSPIFRVFLKPTSVLFACAKNVKDFQNICRKNLSDALLNYLNSIFWWCPMRHSPWYDMLCQMLHMIAKILLCTK